MKEIAKKTGASLESMIFFDNQTNNTSCVAGMKGPTVVYTPEGVTRELFQVITGKIMGRYTVRLYSGRDFQVPGARQSSRTQV